MKKQIPSSCDVFNDKKTPSLDSLTHMIKSIHPMTTRKLLTTALSLLIALGAVPMACAKGDSEFTTSAAKKGKILKQGDDSITIELPGLAGYKVLMREEHGRGWLDLTFGGKTTDLMNDIFNACPGVWPRKANDVVQWRGTRTKGKFTPYAVIFRMVSKKDESTDMRTETMIVIKLDGANSKVMGSVPSDKGGNEAAEALADKLCGPK